MMEMQIEDFDRMDVLEDNGDGYYHVNTDKIIKKEISIEQAISLKDLSSIIDIIDKSYKKINNG